MDKNHSALQPWSPLEMAIIPSNSTPDEMVTYARPQLSTRDMKAIATAFNAESYEMVATFVWSKAVAVLKKQVASLGMEFVGEMLGRPDLGEDSDPATSIGDHEAISLAEDLRMITGTQALRLKQALELVTHFTKLDQQNAEIEMMAREEALMLLRNCITSILSKPDFEGALRFADFRKALSDRALQPEDGEVITITEAPYFFVRTTLSVLLSLVKTKKGAVQEHAIGNVSVLLPKLWLKLREPEKWQVGQVYAEVSAEGNRPASTGLKQALLKVHGFDFVPESLRSNTFSESAARVLSAHFAFNNYFHEIEPMATLANLGTAIPKPAFAKCMEAALAVWLGNHWGISWGAESHARKMLDSLRAEQWSYYLNECLRSDRTVLDKLVDDGPTKRWIELASIYRFHEIQPRQLQIRRLLEASAKNIVGLVQQRAQELRANVES